jgi:hypothetical protein
MGTSTSYNGPTGRISLLPPWADEPIDDDHLGQEDAPSDTAAPDRDDNLVPSLGPAASNTVPPAVAWSAPKSRLTRLARGLGGSLRGVGRAYVAASGGSRRAASAAITGRASTARLASLLAAGTRIGFEQALRQLGVQNLVGRDAQFVLAEFVNLLAPVGDLREAAAARAAMIRTLKEIFDRYDVATGGIDALNALDADGVRALITLSVTNYVTERFLQELVFRIERGAETEERANALMADIRAFIGGIVRLDLKGDDVLAIDWQGAPGRRIIERVYAAAYALLGGEA